MIEQNEQQKQVVEMGEIQVAFGSIGRKTQWPIGPYTCRPFYIYYSRDGANLFHR
jgi:hypothetical protein